MKRTLTPVLGAILFCSAITAIAQSDSTSRVKVDRINPYHSIKTSVFFQVGFGDYLTSSTAVGFEVRKFTGLRHFFFATASIGQNRGHHEYREALYQSWDLSYKTAKLRLGTVVGKELYNLYVGTNYIFDARLNEIFFSYSQGRTLSAAGDITPYINKIAPFVGGCLKIRVLKVVLIEPSMEFGLLETFNPLKKRWAVPSNESPFFNRQRPSLLRTYALAVHIKI
ncbi:MAG TPA: hypothetical protein VF473_04845 [Cyclobacteriaceae bacterium]